MTLDKLNIGQKAIVNSISVNSSIRRRLMDTGLISGTVVECVFISPLGDPRAYLIRGSVAALRSEDASCIDVSII